MERHRTESDSAKYKFFLQWYHWERKKKTTPTCGVEGGDGHNLVIRWKWDQG